MKTKHTSCNYAWLAALAGYYAGISNGLLQEWPKVHKCRQALATALELPHLAPEPAAQAQTPAAVGAATPAAASGTEASTAAPTSVSAGTAGGSLAQDNAAAVEPTPPAAAAGAADAAAAVAAAGAAAADDAGLPWPVLFHHVMGDCQLVPPDQEVPLTGVGEHLDRRLSAVFIEPFEMQVGLGFRKERWVWALGESSLGLGFSQVVGLGFMRVSTYGMQEGVVSRMFVRTSLWEAECA